MKQDDVLIVDVTDYGMNGEGVAKSDGCVIFVPYAMAGERVKIKISYAKKDFATATLLEVLDPSPDRVKPPCNRFGRCGGCDLMHVAYAKQLSIKKDNLITTLRRVGHLEYPVDDCVPSDKPFGYRNKVQLPFGIVNGKVALGFFRENSHKIVSITKCFLHEVWLEKLIGAVLQFCNENDISVYNEETGKGLLRHLVARKVGGALSVVFVINGDTLTRTDKLRASLDKEFDSYALYLSENRKRTNVIMGERLIPLVDKKLTENVLGIEIGVNPLSFMQVNPYIRDEIYRRVVTALSESDVVIDAFSGVGLMGAILAKKGKKVYAVEIIPEAVNDANAMARGNVIADNLTTICGDCTEVLPRLCDKLLQENPNAKISVIVDPPRKGLTPTVTDLLTSLPLTSICYVSCNPATLARDLTTLTQSFTILSITPFDMFSQTRHLETLVCLTRKP